MRSTTELDTHVARLATVTDQAAASASFRDQLLAEILAAPVEGPATRTRKAWFRRPVVVLGSLTALAASTAFAVVTLQPQSKDLTAVECVVSGAEEYVPARTGDPIADCALRWRSETGSAPELTAYGRAGRLVVVQPSSDAPPRGFAALPRGFRQDVALIELDESLYSYVDGLASRCFSPSQAAAFTKAELARLGLVGWTVDIQNSAGCVGYSGSDPVKRVVQLLATRVGSFDTPQDQLGAALRSIEKRCANLNATREAVTTAARTFGWTQANHGLDLTMVPTPSASCTQIYFTPGGTSLITLRGPQG